MEQIIPWAIIVIVITAVLILGLGWFIDYWDKRKAEKERKRKKG